MAITNLRIESRSSELVVLYWSASTAHSVEVLRSTNGTDFTEIDSIAGASGDDLSYEDETVVGSTRYWYKLTDDNEASFSSTVNVTTHLCPSSTIRPRVSLPRFVGEEQQSAELNALVAITEEELKKTYFYGSQSPSPDDQCVVCAVNGAIVLDCEDGCDTFIVETSADITSITILNCGDQCPPLDVTVPASATVGVCGWPPECEFDGDECFQGPIVGGATGRTARTNGLSTKKLIL